MKYWARIDGSYRYVLGREHFNPLSDCLSQAERLRRVLFLLINPSTADGERDDPTSKKCMRFARWWNFDRLLVANLFAFRASKPKELWAAMRAGVDVVGPWNDAAILGAARASSLIVCAWGPKPRARARAAEVVRLLAHRDLHMIAPAKDGTPQHPLFLPEDLKPTLFRSRGR